MASGERFPPEIENNWRTMEYHIQRFFSLHRDNVLSGFQPNMTKKEVSDLLESSYLQTCNMLSSVHTTPDSMDTDAITNPTKYRLEFTHDCHAKSCADEKCHLCSNNQLRPCQPSQKCFQKKYFVHEQLLARCGAPIKVRLMDVRTNMVAKLDTNVVACILNGQSYAQLFPDGIPNCANENVEICQELEFEGKQLLQSLNGRKNTDTGMVELFLKGGEADLQHLRVAQSSEALLGGRRSPFRLLIGVIGYGGLDPAHVVPAVTDDFVVATQRSKLAQKKDVPLKTDQVAILEQIGGQRLGSLQNLGATLRKQLSQDELPNSWPEHVETVQDFLQLAQVVKRDSRLKKKVTSLLRMSENQWAEACDHAQMAVPPDNRPRAWWFPTDNNDTSSHMGLVYSCDLGEIDMSNPRGLVQPGKSPHIIPYDTAFTQDQEMMLQLHHRAKDDWAKSRHPGWEIYPTSENFDSLEFQRNPNILPPPAARPRRDDGNGWKQMTLSPSVGSEEEAMMIDSIAPSQDRLHWSLPAPEARSDLQPYSEPLDSGRPIHAFEVQAAGLCNIPESLPMESLPVPTDMCMGAATIDPPRMSKDKTSLDILREHGLKYGMDEPANVDPVDYFQFRNTETSHQAQ